MEFSKSLILQNIAESIEYNIYRSSTKSNKLSVYIVLENKIT